MPNGGGKLLSRVLPFKPIEKLIVLVDVARNDVEVEPLGGFRLPVHEQGKAFRSGVARPFLDCQPVAFRLGDFLAFFIKEKLIVKSLRSSATERATDLTGKL